MPRSNARVAPRDLAGRLLAACIVGVSATSVAAARLGPTGAHALARPSETNALVLGSAERERNSPERRAVLEVAAEGLFDIFGFEVGASASYDPLCEFVNPLLDDEHKLDCGEDPEA